MTRALPRLVTLLAALLSLAAAPASPPDPEANLVADLVVRAPSGGPAWWKVSSANATVWVLGVPAALPKGLAWSDVVLDRRLNQASRVILPPVASFGVFDVFGAFSLSGKLRAKTPIEATLPPDLAFDQFRHAVAAALRQSPAHYDRWKPAVAGVFMVADFRKAAALEPNQPLSQIRAAAQRHRLRATPAVAYPALPMARMLAGELTNQVNVACLADALDEIEAGAGQVRKSAAAWSVGDTPGALAAERGFERCLAALPNGADLVRRTEADQANAIAQALRTPGVVVAVVEPRPPLAEGGVPDRLRAQGFTVKIPGRELTRDETSAAKAKRAVPGGVSVLPRFSSWRGVATWLQARQLDAGRALTGDDDRMSAGQRLHPLFFHSGVDWLRGVGTGVGEVAARLARSRLPCVSENITQSAKPLSLWDRLPNSSSTT